MEATKVSQQAFIAQTIGLKAVRAPRWGVRYSGLFIPGHRQEKQTLHVATNSSRKLFVTAATDPFSEKLSSLRMTKNKKLEGDAAE